MASRFLTTLILCVVSPGAGHDGSSDFDNLVCFTGLKVAALFVGQSALEAFVAPAKQAAAPFPLCQEMKQIACSAVARCRLPCDQGHLQSPCSSSRRRHSA